MEEDNSTKAYRIGKIRPGDPERKKPLPIAFVPPDCRYCGGELPATGNKCPKCGALIAGRK
jgi:hypothetical protein